VLLLWTGDAIGKQSTRARWKTIHGNYKKIYGNPTIIQLNPLLKHNTDNRLAGSSGRKINMAQITGVLQNNPSTPEA
jgi:hypothetical protein